MAPPPPPMDQQAIQSRQHSSRISHVGGRSSPSHPRPQRRHDESWVEVASQPSSSSLSSVGDEIVTTGLRVANPYNRRRQLQASARAVPRQQTVTPVTATSSQEEYDESQSDEEHVLSSSTDNMQPSAEEAMEDSDGGSDGDGATALGRAPNQPVFRPQPNAFSHPPSRLAQRSCSTNSALPPHPYRGFTRPSFSQRSHTRVQRGGPSFMAPSVREDNDAALRASLTTLLSCAAAARGLPKSKEEAGAQQATRSGVGPSSQPMELCLVPESDLMGNPGEVQTVPAHSQKKKRDSSARPSSRTETGCEKPKRAVSTGRSPRAIKKKKMAVAGDETLISPTLLTWFVSAGVLVLVSVVGFGAGYVIGREVGRQEGLAASVSSVNDTTSSGRDAIRSSGGSLRRFKWGAVGRSIAAQA